jgi:hypothetical protein
MGLATAAVRVDCNYMNPVRQTAGGMTTPEPQAHLLITKGDIELMAESPEQAMEEIRVRATQMSSLLENILHDTHGHPRWGLNE